MTQRGHRNNSALIIVTAIFSVSIWVLSVTRRISSEHLASSASRAASETSSVAASGSRFSLAVSCANCARCSGLNAAAAPPPPPPPPPPPGAAGGGAGCALAGRPAAFVAAAVAATGRLPPPPAARKRAAAAPVAAPEAPWRDGAPAAGGPEPTAPPPQGPSARVVPTQARRSTPSPSEPKGWCTRADQATPPRTALRGCPT